MNTLVYRPALRERLWIAYETAKLNRAQEQKAKEEEKKLQSEMNEVERRDQLRTQAIKELETHDSLFLEWADFIYPMSYEREWRNTFSHIDSTIPWEAIKSYVERVRLHFDSVLVDLDHTESLWRWFWMYGADMPSQIVESLFQAYELYEQEIWDRKTRKLHAKYKRILLKLLENQKRTSVSQSSDIQKAIQNLPYNIHWKYLKNQYWEQLVDASVDIFITIK